MRDVITSPSTPGTSGTVGTPKSRGKYASYTPNDRASIGKCCAENGPASTVRKFKCTFPELNESSARYMHEKYKEAIVSRKRKLDFSEVTEIHSRKRGRPLLLGEELDFKVQKYISALREGGSVINTVIVVSTAKGIIEAIDKNMLVENGGSLSIGKDWAKSIMSRMNLVKRKGSTSCKNDKVENLDQLKDEYLTRIQDFVSEYDIPTDMIINWDHAGLNIIPVSDWTMDEKGKKRVEISDLGDKRQNTAIFACSLTGEFLPSQVIFGGKTDRCHPNYKFPGDCHITHSENHWANSETQLAYFDHVILPYLEKARKRLSLPKESKALCIFDVFRAQMTDQFRDHLSKNHVKIVYVPACCTDRLQPIDVSVQKSVKAHLKASFESWYLKEITKQMGVGSDKVCPVEMPLHLMKEQFSKWLVSMFQCIKAKSDLIVNGFRAAGIASALEDIMPLNQLKV